MGDKNLSDEFKYLRDHIERAGRLLSGDAPALVEASFLLGCLHSICQDNANYFQDIECKAALHGE